MNAEGASSTSTSLATDPSSTSSATTGDGGAPDCDTVMLPGDPADVAATPRPDRDAEILALELAPQRFVAREADYEIVAGDLAAIRELSPALGDVHIDCRVPTGYSIWFFVNVDLEVVEAIWRGTFSAWECHNAFYGVEHGPPEDSGDVTRIDGIGFAMQVDGVYAPEFASLYSAIPGLEDANISAYWRDPHEDGCEETDGTITLTATVDADDRLDERTYRFEHPELGTIVYRAVPGAPPMQVG